MKIDKVFTDDNQVKVTAEFEPELLEQFMRKAARKIAQRTRIPGFRPGKAPYAMVLNHVGEAAIKEEAIELMLDKVYPEVLAEGEINPYGPGSLDAIKSENPPIFEFTIPLESSVELGDLDSLHEEYAPEKVQDTEVEEFITHTRRRASTIVPVETPAEEGSLVYITVEEIDLNPSEDSDPIMSKEQPQQLMIPTETEENENEFPFKGFSRSLIGHGAGEVVELEHEFPADYPDEAYQGKKVLFKVALQSVKALELPEMNEEFLKDMGDFGSVEDFEKAVRDRLQADADADYDQAYYTGLVDKIRERSQIKYPPQMLEEEEKQVLDRFEHELSHQHLDLDVYLKLRKTDEEAFIAEEVRPTAINRLERSLVMEALTKKFEIKIEEKQLEQEISTILGELVSSGELMELQKELGEKKFANVISMEAANRAIEKSIRSRIRAIASPESVPAEDSTIGQPDNETVEEKEAQSAE